MRVTLNTVYNLYCYALSLEVGKKCKRNVIPLVMSFDIEEWVLFVCYDIVLGFKKNIVPGTLYHPFVRMHWLVLM